MDTQMVDREPHRSVQLIRRIDTRMPPNLLSQSPSTGITLGKLADLRAPARASPTAAPASTAAPRATRGWNSVLTAPPAAPSPNNLSVWTSPMGSERISRSTTPSNPLVQPVAAETAAAPSTSTEAVPDNWEDDA